MSLVLPLCFRHTGPVMGKGFLAHVDIAGRLVAAIEADGFWLYGVNPGALSVGASTLAEASQTLRDVLSRTLIDFAEQADDFSRFKQAIESYFNSTDADLAEWERAVEMVKRGQVAVPDGLRRCPDPELYVKVSPRGRLEDLTPQDNPVLDQQLAAVA